MENGSGLSKLAESLQFGQQEGLRVVVDSVGKLVNKRLLSLMFEKSLLMRHCVALKRYLLLGQGDFIQLLMDLIG